jgi:tetratricopeptide (TPR) repeat protein
MDVNSHIHQSLADFCADVLSEIAAEFEMGSLGLRDWLERTFITSRGTRGTVPAGLPTTAGMPYSITRGLENRHLLTADWSSGTLWYTLANDRLIAAIRHLNRPTPIDSAPSIDAASHIRIAATLLTKGELVLAEKHAWHALKAAGGEDLRLQADARSLLGNIAFERGIIDVAEEHYRRAAELSEQLGDQSAVGRLLGAIGRLHATQGRYTAALDDLQSAVTRVPDDLTLQTELAKALWHAGQAQAAAAVFGTVLTIEPDFAEALAGRAQVCAENGNAFSVLDDLRTLQRLRPKLSLQPEVRSAYALALARVGRPETAMEEADAALASAPDNGLIFLRAARVASASGALERATALLRRAAEASNPALSSSQLDEARRLLSSGGEPDA